MATYSVTFKTAEKQPRKTGDMFHGVWDFLTVKECKISADSANSAIEQAFLIRPSCCNVFIHDESGKNVYPC
jgi:uncharacterized protein YjaG (DUF416 family)